MVDVKNKRVFISVNDPSADAHCAGLISALKQGGGGIEFVGIGGPKMAAAGCELIENTVGRAVMTYTAIAHAGHYYRLVRRVRRYLQEHPVDLVIVCDSPAFNFHVAKVAKRAGIKTLFYVAPQLWAWASWRIHKLRRLCDKLCCILPFEEEWFRQRGVDTTFVGNPLLDKLPSDLTSLRKDYSHFDPHKVKVALMPGSRLAEIESLWRPMQEIAVELKRRYPGVSFTAVAASEERRQLLERTQIPGFTCEYSVDTVRADGGGGGLLHRRQRQCHAGGGLLRLPDGGHVSDESRALEACRPVAGASEVLHAGQSPGRPRACPGVHAVLHFH